MSHNDSILNLLNLKDVNIIFNESFLSEELINGAVAKVFNAKLTYYPDACYHCGSVFDDNIIKHGFKTSRIKLPKVSGFDTYLKLKKQRYFCRHCNSTFTLNTDIVPKNCFISYNTKLSIALNAKDKISEKDIAKYHNVSHSTVNRIIDSFYLYYKPNFDSLPEHLCFDEFKSVKASDSAMSFIFCNSVSGKIIDIVEDRRLHVLRNYFLKYSKAARMSVKTIVIDMYSPYISLINEVLPNAKIIIDKFHIIQLFSRSLNKTRIKIMNMDKKNGNKNYNKLKRYWKLLLKDKSKVNYSTYHYHRSFKKLMREIDIINYLIDLSPELKASYELYHDIRHCIQTKDYDLLIDIVTKGKSSVSDYMKTSVSSLIKYKDYIKNSLIYNYTNAVLEGTNNIIKVIKRIAFGYRSFLHFKNRILITQNLAVLKA